MKIESYKTPALVFINVGALAVAIIGAIAFKQLGAFHDFAPLKGVIMMGSAGAFFCTECVLIAKLQEKMKLLTKYGMVEILPPTKNGDSWSIKLPNFDAPLPFQGMFQNARPNNNEFMTRTHKNGDYLELMILYRHQGTWFDHTIYCVSLSKKPDMNYLKQYKDIFETIIKNEMAHRPSSLL